MKNLCEYTLAELSTRFQAGELTSREITESFIASIEARDEKINAFVTTTFDLAREMADAADSRQKNGTLLSPIDGMPIALKDVVCTKGIKTTACSNILKNFVPPYDATVWEKLKAAGVVLLGKTNTDEFTMGSSTETSAFGVTRNPYNLDCVAGGSSGGSTAAVAANMCAAAIGTDTGGSIRQPAHFCGVTGLKVSYGRVSRYGVIPMAPSLDTIGPIAKTAEDCALLLEVLAGQDPKDATTQPDTNTAYVDDLEDEVSGLKIGLAPEYFPEHLNEETVQILDAAKEVIKGLGANFSAIDMPHTHYSIPAYYIIAPSEISANMSRFDGLRFGEGEAGKDLDEIYSEARKEGFGDEVKRRILLGTFALSAGYADEFYKKAQKVRTLIIDDFDKAFKKVDIILAPVAPTPAFKIGEKSENPVDMYMEDIFCNPASLAGMSAISVPFGQSKDGLPIGIQLIAPQLGEAKLLRLAHQLQKKL